jgi:glutathione S-transferase
VYRLISIPFSHYNEKARWALDRFGVAYRETRWMPLLHAPAVAVATLGRVGRPDRMSTRFSTPVLVTGDGRPICDSSEIVRFVSDRFAPPSESLYPTEEVGELEARFGAELGPHTRRLAYSVVLGQRGMLQRIADNNVGRVQSFCFRAVGPLVGRGVAKFLRVVPDAVERSIERVRAEMAWVSERLGGRRWLVGDRFTAADLAFACMAAPVVLPSRADGYGAWLPPAEELPPEPAALVREMRESPAGRFALRLFREERRPRAMPA